MFTSCPYWNSWASCADSLVPTPTSFFSPFKILLYRAENTPRSIFSPFNHILKPYLSPPPCHKYHPGQTTHPPVLYTLVKIHTSTTGNLSLLPVSQKVSLWSWPWIWINFSHSIWMLNVFQSKHINVEYISVKSCEYISIKGYMNMFTKVVFKLTSTMMRPLGSRV